MRDRSDASENFSGALLASLGQNGVRVPKKTETETGKDGREACKREREIEERQRRERET